MQSPRHNPHSPAPTAHLLLAAYSQGMFPMARSRHGREVDWYRPDPRAILPLDGLRVSRSLRQRVRSGVFDIRRDTRFDDVIRACAQLRPEQGETWINDGIIRAYGDLHRLGHAHSVECFRDDRLVGGLYGVTLGGVFFGESMFSRPELGGTDASKVALVHLVSHLNDRGFVLLDSQISSPHMRRLGAVDIPLARFMAMLEDALRIDATFT